MDLGEKLVEGKTKIVHAHPTDPALAVVLHKDGITAGDGVRRNEIVGKGILSGRTTANVFALLNQAGIATHYVSAPEPNVMVVRRCTMIPLEVVMRRLATGSYLRRYPDVSEGTRFDPPLVEFFLKDDARHDPQVTTEEIPGLAVATAAEVAHMIEDGRRVFAVIETAWAKQDVTLVDLKIEFGRPVQKETPSHKNDQTATLIVADVIDNDSWRIWPGGDKTRMLDKQVYRNMSAVTEQGLDEIRRRYEIVADLTDAWRLLENK
jgi:phosphoribosylaminoimidazole-succinocarboxamide synthase